jgi:hypothetical protein
LFNDILCFIGVYKKLVALGKKKKAYSIITDWAHSISNHLYWVAASSKGNALLVKEKWLSLLNHVVNIHTGHGMKFRKCAHSDLSMEERVWITKGLQLQY